MAGASEGVRQSLSLAPMSRPTSRPLKMTVTAKSRPIRFFYFPDDMHHEPRPIVKAPAVLILPSIPKGGDKGVEHMA